MTSSSRRHSRRRKTLLTRPRLLVLAGVVAALGLAGGGYHLLTTKDAEDHLRAAEALVAKGNRKGAEIELKNALQQEPDNAAARYELGRLHFAAQDYAAAEKELSHARAKGHQDPDLLPMLARTLLALREPKRVADEIKVPDGAPADTAAAILALRARAQLMLGDGAAADQSLQAADAARPNHPDTLMTRAQMAVAAGQPDAALGLVEQAIAADGRRADLWVMRGDLLRMARQRDAALAAYRKASALEPANLPARLATTLMHLEANQLDQAAADLREIGKTAPDNLMARYLGALVDFRRGQHAEANTKLQQVLKSAPDFLPGQLLAGAVNLALGNRNISVAHLNRVIERAPDHAYARKLLATAMLQGGQVDRAAELVAGLGTDDDLLAASLQGDIALRKGDYAAARQHLEKASGLAPDNPALLIELAKSRMGSGDASGAIAALNRAAEADTATARPDMLLVQTHLKAGRYAEAMAVVDRLAKERPQDPLTQNLRGVVHLARKDVASARASFAQALRIDPAYLPAAANLARLDLQANDAKSARARFEAVLAKDPRNSRAWLALAGLSMARNDEAGYLNDLTQAKRANPKDAAPYNLLARYWLSKQDAGKALAEARAGLDATGRTEFHEVIGMAQVSAKDNGAALQSFRKWVEASPDNPIAHLRLAQAFQRSGDTENALNSADRALQLAPDLAEAQSAKALILAGLGRSEDALKLARAMQQGQPKSPLGYLTEAEIQGRTQKPLAAAEAYAKAARLARNPALVILAHQAYAAAGQAAQGEALLGQWLADTPNDPAVRHQLASALLKARKLDAAAKHYEHLLKANPKDLAAANNLAWIYGELKDPRALAWAETAYKLNPDNPATLDTLGWILVNRGETARGLDLLRKALSKAPDAPEIRWHLAFAYAQAGDRNRARQELERLVNSGETFAQEAEARQLLASLKK